MPEDRDVCDAIVPEADYFWAQSRRYLRRARQVKDASLRSRLTELGIEFESKARAYSAIEWDRRAG